MCRLDNRIEKHRSITSNTPQIHLALASWTSSALLLGISSTHNSRINLLFRYKVFHIKLFSKACAVCLGKFGGNNAQHVWPIIVHTTRGSYEVRVVIKRIRPRPKSKARSLKWYRWVKTHEILLCCIYLVFIFVFNFPLTMPPRHTIKI